LWDPKTYETVFIVDLTRSYDFSFIDSIHKKMLDFELEVRGLIENQEEEGRRKLETTKQKSQFKGTTVIPFNITPVKKKEGLK
jgi:hypothetical protein